MALGIPFVLFALLMPPIRLQTEHRHAERPKENESQAGPSSASHSIGEDASLIAVGDREDKEGGVSSVEGRENRVSSSTSPSSSSSVLSWWKHVALKHILTSWWKHVALKHILTSYVWNCNNAGYIFVEWVLQTLSFWGPKAMLEMYPQYSSSVSDSMLGISGLIAGTVGSIAGGLLLDFLGTPSRKDQELVDLKMAFFLSLIFSFVGALLLFASFYPHWSIWIFSPASCLSLMSLSAIAPLNYALAMDSVPCPLRPMSLATMIAFQRVAGDMTAPPLTGYLQSTTHDWHITIGFVAFALLGAVIFFGLGWLFKYPQDPPKPEESNEALALMKHIDVSDTDNLQN